MSSVAKTVAASTSPIPTRPGSNARAVSSNYGQVSELFSQTGVRSDGESPGFEEYRKRENARRDAANQPPTLKIAGTSRSFAMLFEEVQSDNAGYDRQNAYDSNGLQNNGVPAFQAYMSNATNTYEQSTKSVAGDYKNVGRSLNLAM